MCRFIVGLTGGVASGKSVFSQFFADWQVPIIDADTLAHRLLDTAPIRSHIHSLVGSAALQADGTINRAYLRRQLFGSSALRHQVESLLHPPIRAALAAAAHSTPLAEDAYLIVVIPLLIESGGRASYPWLKRIAALITPTQARIQRLIRRDQIDLDLAQQMLDAQANDAQRRACADDVVINSGSLEQLRAQALALHTRYSALAKQQ